MFGGLDLKGGGGSAGDKKNEQSDAPAPAASAFSFLNSVSSPEPADATSAPETSAFSFLSSSAPVAKDNNEEIPSPATGSAFGFMSSEEGEGASKAPTSEAAPTTSSFSFMQAPAVPDSSAPVEAAAPAQSSNFSFLSGASDAASTVSRESTDTAGTGLSATHVDTTTKPSNSFGGPAGSGVVFGGASVASKKPIKRRARTKVGVAAINSPATGLVAATTARPPLPGIPATKPESSREAADQAARRAEEFMKKQQVADADAQAKRVSREGSPPAIQSAKSEEDDIVAAAKAAAEEAQHMSQKSRFGLGGLFRTRSGNTHHSSNALHGSTSSRPPVPTPQPVQSATSVGATGTGNTKDGSVSAADRLQKEQEESKRAMAERQLKMMQEQTKGEREAAEPPATVQTIEKNPNTATSSAVKTPAAPVVPTFKPVTPITVNPVPIKKAVTPPRHIVVPKTPTDEFHKMMSEFGSKVERSMEEVTRLRQQRIGLLEERFVTLAKERLATQQKEQAEVQQMAAAESEDFEMADRMGAVIDNHEREREEYAAFLESIGQAIQQLDSQKELVVNGVSSCFKDIQSKLKRFQEEQESKETGDATEDLKKFSRVSKQLSAEQERLEQDLKHIERDAKLVEEEEKELEIAISEQSGEFEKVRDDAKVRLTEVETEIDELRKLLAAKQKVAAELRTEIAGHEDSILRVRFKFTRQLDRVKKKKHTIEDNREEYEAENKTHQRNKEQHEAQVKAHSEALLARDQLLDSLSKEIEMADTFESIVAKEMSFEISAKDDDELDDPLAQLQADVVKCEAAVTESKEVLKAVTVASTNLEEEIKTLELRIPELEEAKKEAASRRDFKAAGKASKEVKEAIARLKECQEECEGEGQQRKLAAEEEVKKLELALDEKRKVAHEKEKESGIATMKRLADNIKRLSATKQSVCGKAEINTIQGVAAFVLEGQIKSLQSEGQAYGDKYGGWNKLTEECGFDNGNAPGESTPPKVSTDDKVASEDQSRVPDAEKESSRDDAKPQGTEAKKEAPLTEDKASSMQQFLELTQSLKEVEDSLETAVANEDYEEAAVLDEKLQNLLAKVQSLSLTDEEMELALSSSSPPKAEEPKAARANDIIDDVANVEEDAAQCPPAEVAQEAASIDDVSVEEVEKAQKDAPIQEEAALSPEVTADDSKDDSHEAAVPEADAEADTKQSSNGASHSDFESTTKESREGQGANGEPEESKATPNENGNAVAVEEADPED